ncbi:hypothetical protein Peur_039172 [Populus x canadensis]
MDTDDQLIQENLHRGNPDHEQEEGARQASDQDHQKPSSQDHGTSKESLSSSSESIPGTLRKLWKAARSLQAGFEKALAFGISNLCLVANFPTSAGF